MVISTTKFWLFFDIRLEGVAKSQSRLSGVIVKTGDQLGKIIWGPCLFWVTTIQSGAFGLNLVFNVATRFKWNHLTTLKPSLRSSSLSRSLGSSSQEMCSFYLATNFITTGHVWWCCCFKYFDYYALIINIMGVSITSIMIIWSPISWLLLTSWCLATIIQRGSHTLELLSDLRVPNWEKSEDFGLMTALYW